MATQTLSRAELQQLAKQHGIKANMKNSEIEAALLEKGIDLASMAGEAPAKKKGLSVRDSNAMEEPTAGASKTTKSKTAKAEIVVAVETTEGENSNPQTRQSRFSKPAAVVEAENPENPPLPTTRRTTRRSAAAQESEKPEPEELPLAQRRARRSTSLPGKDQEVEAPAKRTSRARESAAVEKENVMAVQGSTADLDDKTADQKASEGETADEESSSKPVEEQEARLSSAPVGRYASRRMSKQRDSILTEIAKEMSVAEEESTKPLEDKTAEAAVVKSDIDNKAVEAAAAETLRSVVNVVAENIIAAEEKSLEVTPLTETMNMTVISSSAEAPVVMESPATTDVKRTEPIASEGKRLLGGNAVRVVRRVAVPDLPPTPEASSKSAVKTEVKVVEDEEKPKGKLSFGRRIAVPLIPPTPADVRLERDAREKEKAEELERMRRKVKGALEVLDELYGHLAEQKRLREALEATREENKRLREALRLEE